MCRFLREIQYRQELAGVLLLLFSIIVSGCGPQTAVSNQSSSAKTVQVQDDMGRTVSVPVKPARVVVLSASFLEPFHAVGGEVVGRPDSKTDMPDFAKDVASVGEVYRIDMEKVLELQPDVVIVNKGMNEKLVSVLESNHIPAVVVDMKNYEDVRRNIKLFAQITGEPEKGGELIEEMDNKIKTVQDRMPKEAKRVAILHSTAQGLSVQLDGSIAGSVAKMLGFQNVASAMTPMQKNPDAAPYSMETLVEQNPEILFITSMGKMDDIKKSMQETINGNPAWQTIPAIRDNRYYYLPQDLFLLSPGIHYPEAVETMAKLIYPGAF